MQDFPPYPHSDFFHVHNRIQILFGLYQLTTLPHFFYLRTNHQVVANHVLVVQEKDDAIKSELSHELLFTIKKPEMRSKLRLLKKDSANSIKFKVLHALPAASKISSDLQTTYFN